MIRVIYSGRKILRPEILIKMIPEITVLICGGRDFTDEQFLEDKLLEYFDENLKGCYIRIIHGNAKGADKLAGKFADKYDLFVISYPAKWNLYGLRAGPIRNQQMLDEGEPDVVLAFPTPKSKGTWDMVNRAKKAGVKVKVFQ